MVLPHDWVPPAGGASFFQGLDPSWLDLTSVSAVSESAEPTVVDGSSLHYPAYQRAAELKKPNFDSANALIRSGVSLQNLLTLNNLISGTVTDQALGSTSYSARTRPIANRASTDQSRVWIEARLRSVHVTAPAGGHAVELERPVPGDDHQRPETAGDGRAGRQGRRQPHHRRTSPGGRGRQAAACRCC
jgi:hypothetical protein